MANPSSHLENARVTNSPQASMFKNKLQEYTQRLALPLPAYRAANEGFQHAPKFRSTVFVAGAEYTSKSTFRHLRDAEQDAAKLAYECIISNAQQNGFNPMLSKDSKSSKSILHEFTFKKHELFPKYQTCHAEGREGLPVFVSKVTVKDQTFTGAAAGSKKEAEQLAAHTALQSLLGTESGSAQNQMLNFKRKQFNSSVTANCSELNQKKIKNVGTEGPGSSSQTRSNITLLTPAPRSLASVSGPVIRRQPQPNAQGVKFENRKVMQGANLPYRKFQQRGRFP